jgi:hypothetical protein
MLVGRFPGWLAALFHPRYFYDVGWHFFTHVSFTRCGWLALVHSRCFFTRVGRKTNPTGDSRYGVHVDQSQSDTRECTAAREWTDTRGWTAARGWIANITYSGHKTPNSATASTRCPRDQSDDKHKPSGTYTQTPRDCRDATLLAGGWEEGSDVRGRALLHRGPGQVRAQRVHHGILAGQAGAPNGPLAQGGAGAVQVCVQLTAQHKTVLLCKLNAVERSAWFGEAP